MTLDPTATLIYCQTCANSWEKTDSNTGYYFRSPISVRIGDYGSPALINGLGEEITFCPRCDVDTLAESYRKPVDGIQESPFYKRDSRLKDADVDRGGRITGTADVVHDAKELPSGSGE